MKIYNNICGGQGVTPANTGANSQCLEAVTVMAFIAKDDFAFDTVDAFKLQANWDAAIASRDLVPMYEMYEVAPNNTDATYYESRNFRKRTQKATKITTYEHYLGYCSHAALKSYENSSYTRLFEVTEDGDILGVYASDGVKVRGQKIKQFDVGIRMIATVEKPPYTPIQITFDDHEEVEMFAVLATPDFDPVTDISGVYNVTINQSGAATSSLVTFTAFVGCDNDYKTGLDAEFQFMTAAGVDQSATFADVGNGTYTATGVGFVTGYIDTAGVKTIDSLQVEGAAIITVTA